MTKPKTLKDNEKITLVEKLTVTESLDFQGNSFNKDCLDNMTKECLENTSKQLKNKIIKAGGRIFRVIKSKIKDGAIIATLSSEEKPKKLI